MKFTDVSIKRYQWEAPCPPTEFLGQLRAIIREEKRICGTVYSPEFRVRFGRVPTGLHRSIYEGTVEASESGTRVTASVKPALTVRGNVFVTAVFVAMGLFLIPVGLVVWFSSNRTDHDAIPIGVAVGFVVLGLLINAGARAWYWLDAESLHQYLIEHFRKPVQFWRRSG